MNKYLLLAKNAEYFVQNPISKNDKRLNFGSAFFVYIEDNKCVMPIMTLWSCV